MAIEIAVFGADDSPRGKRFVEALRASGGIPWMVSSFAPDIPATERICGALFFDGPSVRTPSAMHHIRQMLAFLGIPWFRVGNDSDAGPNAVDAEGGWLRDDKTDDALIHALTSNRHSAPLTSETELHLAESFATAGAQALREMAHTEPVVRRTFRQAIDRWLGDVAAEIMTEGKTFDAIAFGATDATALALTRRVLGNANRTLDAGIIEDCMGELANVIAGQAKALLAQSTHRFTFATPHVMRFGTKENRSGRRDVMVASLFTDCGPVAVQWRPPRYIGESRAM
ncbi:MAG: chemotaxis protein CheX [Gemmataceae bacterium]